MTEVTFATDSLKCRIQSSGILDGELESYSFNSKREIKKLDEDRFEANFLRFNCGKENQVEEKKKRK